MIVLPESKPETVWVRGRALRKVSPQRNHGRLQTVLAGALDSWAEGRGEVATEWRFRVADISFVRNERLRDLSDEEAQIPLFAPDVAIEILSPDDRRVNIDDKVDVLLRAGTTLIVLVDAPRRTVELHDVFATRMLHLPGFRYSLRKLFAKLALPR